MGNIVLYLCTFLAFVGAGMCCNEEERTYIKREEEDELSFHSPTSLYQQLVSPIPHKKRYWVTKCSEIGSGWIPAILTSKAEYDFLVGHQKELNKYKNYWIGGSCRAKGNIPFSYYLSYDKGSYLHPVFVSTQEPLTQDNGNLQLISGSDDLELHGVLCENDGLLYQSDTSYYRKLVSDNKSSYSEWSNKCTELGDGWESAVADDPEELKYYQENNRISTDDSSYFIGGIAYETMESQGYSSDSSARVLVTKVNGNEFSSLVVTEKSEKFSGILCEITKS